MKNLTLLLTIMCSTIGLWAQASVLNGRVVDDRKLPLAGATLLIEGVAGTTTDADGYYAFVKLPAGSHDILISYIGFEEQTLTVEVAEGSSVTQDFILQPGVN